MLREIEVRWMMIRGTEVSYEQVLQVLPEDEEEEVVEDLEPAYRLDYERQSATRTSEYILRRGFTPQTLRHWGFRYDADLQALIIPVFDLGGEKLVGVIRRMVPPVRPGFPKYLYSPGFRRAEHLFGGHLHPREGTVILVEGPLDAVWLHQNGYPEAVALMGVYCSKRQQALLARLGTTVILCLDNDEAGWEGTERLMSQLSPLGDVMVAPLLAGRKDAQELTTAELGQVFGELHRGWEVDHD